MRNLCFTERSLQFSKFAHKSLGSSISLPSLFFLSLCFILHWRQISLSLSLALSSPLPGSAQRHAGGWQQVLARALGAAGRGCRALEQVLGMGGCSERGGAGAWARGRLRRGRAALERWGRRACPSELAACRARRRCWSGPAARELWRAGWASPRRNCRRCAGLGASDDRGHLSPSKRQWSRAARRSSAARPGPTGPTAVWRSNCAGHRRGRGIVVQSNDVHGNGVQGDRARYRRSCSAAAASGSAREQRGHTWRTSEAVEEKAAEGMALMQADHGPRGGGGAVMARRAGRRGGKAKAATGRDKLVGATVQPGTASSLHPCGSRGRSNAARVRRAAQDRRRW
jgi:hypothetical protein